MSLSGLGKKDQGARLKASDEDIDKLLNASQVIIRSGKKERKKATYKRCTFSLTENINNGFKEFAKNARMQTGELSKDNDAVKAAYLCFSELTEAERTEFFEKTKTLGV